MPIRTLFQGLVLLALGVGCVRAPRVMAVGRDPYVFWPPPPATTLREGLPAVRASTMGEAAAALASTLRDAGYIDVRWYPIGAHYEHGFAVTTRLERIGVPAERWPETYPEPVELRWLEKASEPVLPAVGRYRAFLVAFTDLPGGPASGRAPTWDATTVMETGLPAGPLPVDRAIASTFQGLAFAYEYVRTDEMVRLGRRCPRDGT